MSNNKYQQTNKFSVRDRIYILRSFSRKLRDSEANSVFIVTLFIPIIIMLILSSTQLLNDRMFMLKIILGWTIIVITVATAYLIVRMKRVNSSHDLITCRDESEISIAEVIIENSAKHNNPDVSYGFVTPPPTQEEVHEAEINPWPGHSMRETILRNRGLSNNSDTSHSDDADLPDSNQQ